MLSRVLLAAAVLSVLSSPAWGSIVAKSTISECIAESGTETGDRIDASCNKKLVVAMTVSADEGSSQKIQANIARATDSTQKDIKNIQLQNPLRIIINKSPVLVNYRLYQVGYVSNYPHEVVRPRRIDTCRDDWFSEDWMITCPFKKNFKNEKVFDSQGFCCYCNIGAHFYTRGSSVGCARRNGESVGHCLVFDEYNYYVFGLYPPDFKFTITITIQRFAYNRRDGGDVWEDVSTLEIGPHKRIASSSTHQVKAEYIADFNPSEFVQTTKLANRYLLVPDSAILNIRNPLPKVYHSQSSVEHAQFISSFKNASEWMAVPKTLFDLSRSSCDKIGVGYSAFKHQETRCTSKIGSCLKNQPFLLWKEEKEATHNGKQGQYMLHNFGKVHSVPHTSELTDYQVNFIANRPTKSLIVVSLVADDMKVIVHKSPGRIVEAYIESFEALSSTGTLLALVQNIGSITATYNVFVVHCSAGIDMVPSLSVTLDPNEISNVSFIMHSFHAVGKTNYCTLELNDVDGDLLDNMTVAFETLDTCFCYGYCGCACGDGNTTCPDPPKMDDGDAPHIQNPFPPEWLEKLGNFFHYAAPKLLMTFWIILMLLCLGVIKIVHLIITGDFKPPPGAVEPATAALMVAKQVLEKILKEWLPRAFQACNVCCEKSISCCFASCFCILTGGKSKQDEVMTRKVGIGWRVPKNCNGMCKGARFTRRKHRKLMRINKRKGMKNETAWYQKPYKCTCKVKDNMPCCDILKGLFFFHYCLLLPLIWLLHYLWVYGKRKWKRHKRKKKFRQSRAERIQEENQAYLQLDKYSRGKIEREILDLSQDIKAKRHKRLIEESEGYNPEDDDVITLEPKSSKQETLDSAISDTEDKIYASSADDSSDTSDADEAGDIDELLSPGDPVYFNYPLANTLPPSIQNPGKTLSVQGRIRHSEKEKGVYIFDLYKYTYQVKEVRQGKVCLLKAPRLLTKTKEFEHSLDREKALRLITLAPLFACLNDTTTFVMKMQSRIIPTSQ